MKPFLELDNITFRRDGLMILDNINWTISRGEHWALLGANGSGKTSLLKIITAYEWPHEGIVEVMGERFGQTDVRELRKRIGWVTNSLTQWIPDHATALEVAVSGIEASIGLYRDFSPEEIERGEESLRRLGALTIANRSYGVLSQGERQRALIARALTARPELLILDEPCVGLDPAAREQFLADLNGMAQAPDSPLLILVTHHIEEIPRFITHAHLLRGGRTLGQGSIGDVLTDKNLSLLFDRACRIESRNGRYALTFESR